MPESKQSRLAKVYRSVEDWSNGSEKHQLQLFTDCNLGVQDKMNHKPAFESGGAGLCSTADDYMKFALMLANGGQIEKARFHGLFFLLALVSASYKQVRNAD